MATKPEEAPPLDLRLDVDAEERLLSVVKPIFVKRKWQAGLFKRDFNKLNRCSFPPTSSLCRVASLLHPRLSGGCLDVLLLSHPRLPGGWLEVAAGCLPVAGGCRMLLGGCMDEIGTHMRLLPK